MPLPPLNDILFSVIMFEDDPIKIPSLLFAETLLAFLEGFYATSISELVAYAETVTVNLKKTEGNSGFDFMFFHLLVPTKKFS